MTDHAVATAEARPSRWDAAGYHANSSAQATWGRAVHDQLALAGDETIFDLGCGDGRLTAALAARVPRGRVVGFDADPGMIDFARRHHSSPNVEYVPEDLRRLAPSLRADVIVSTAALHWIAEQEEVLRRCRRATARGGRLLFQMGGRGNCAEILATAAEVAASPAWARLLPTFPDPWTFLGPEEYRAWLPRNGFHCLRAELLPREMVHDGPAQLGDWARTTWMPILDRLPDERRLPFIEEVVGRYLRAHPVDAQGRTHVAMVRLEVKAVAV